MTDNFINQLFIFADKHPIVIVIVVILVVSTLCFVAWLYKQPILDIFSRGTSKRVKRIQSMQQQQEESLNDMHVKLKNQIVIFTLNEPGSEISKKLYEDRKKELAESIKEAEFED